MDELTGLDDSNLVSSESFKLNSSPPEHPSSQSSLGEEFGLIGQVPGLNVKEGFRTGLDGSTKPTRLMTRLGLDSSARLSKQIISRINGHQWLEILQVTHYCQNKFEYFRGGWISALKIGDRIEGSSIVIEGWLVGENVQPIAVRFRNHQTVLEEVLINIPRPDVLKVHFYDSICRNCGYKASLNLQKIFGTVTLNVDAIFPNGEVVPAGIIKLHKYN